MPLPVGPDELRRIPALAKLPADQLERLAAAMVRQTYDAGQIIFLEGEPSSGLWFVVDGSIKVIRQSLTGRIQALCLMNRGTCFGTCPLFNNMANPATAEATTDVTLLVVPQERMEEFIQRDPPFAAALFRIYSQRLTQLAQLSERLGSWNVSDRINDCLLEQAEEGELWPVVSMSHEKLATLAGTVREVVTRHLSALEKEGLIRVEPERITLLDTAGLTRPCVSQRLTSRGM